MVNALWKVKHGHCALCGRESNSLLILNLIAGSSPSLAAKDDRTHTGVCPACWYVIGSELVSPRVQIPSKIRIVYIAGPYGDKDGYLAIDRNIARAREAADWLIAHGIGYLCPHMNSAHFEVIRPSTPVTFWYDMDLALMRCADALLLLEGSVSSVGAAGEVEHAKSLGLPVFAEHDHDAIVKWAFPGAPL